MSAAALAELKILACVENARPTSEDKAALHWQACSQLQLLSLQSVQSVAWVQALALHVPSLNDLQVWSRMRDEHVRTLLTMPHLTSLTFDRLYILSDDYSSAPCSWKCIEFASEGSSDITHLPLHTVDSPVKCASFMLILADYATDIAAIRAARPHLLRCGGIKMEEHQLDIRIVYYCFDYTQEQAAQVLAEWAPCLPVPKHITCDTRAQPLLEEVVAQLWPGAEVAWSDDDEWLGEEGSDQEGSDDWA